MSLVAHTRSDVPIAQIAGYLDGLDHASRLQEIYSLSGADQMQLYEKAADSPALDLAYFVPPDMPDRCEVIHYGKNSQPIFRMFQKRWCRPAGTKDELWGYNETVVRPLIGPGYFVAHETAQGGSDPRGAIVVDYFRVPDGAVVAGWPGVRPNREGLQRFVYDQTRDYMRRVSDHVSIGIAYRKESRVMGTFVLCRQPDRV
jgi:hypothetical protein